MKRPASHLSLGKSTIRTMAILQGKLNSIIDPQWRDHRTLDDWSLAITIESCEAIDSYPWKWWKRGNEANLHNVRVELVDILHFSLSGTIHNDSSATFLGDAQLPEVGPLTQTKAAIAIFRKMIALASTNAFDEITRMVIACSYQLEFNIVGYYIAKHTLNYIRQLHGYRSGEYKKVVDGKEDNELLHACVEKGPDILSDDRTTQVEAMNKISAAVYAAFNVAEADQRTIENWLS